ncbi:MAG: TATA-box-binding protein [Thermoproteota archaeon]
MQTTAEKPEKPIVEIQNVVASVILDQRIDLNQIVKNFENVEYKPDQFPGLVFRLEKPKTATLIFSSGKMVSTGAKSEKQAHEAVHKIVRELRAKKIIQKTKPQITVQNIVASATLPGKIDLEQAVVKLERTMYEPEQFPGLIYRMHDPDVVILLFASGKLVCTGAVNEQMVYDAAEKLMAELIQKGLLIR